MKKILINLLALLIASSNAVLIDALYCIYMKGKESSVYPSTLFYTECLVIGLSIFVFLFTYSFYKQKMEDYYDNK